MRKVGSVKAHCLFLEIAVMITKISEGEYIPRYSTVHAKKIPWHVYIYTAVLITANSRHGVDIKSVVLTMILYVFIGYQKA